MDRFSKMQGPRRLESVGFALISGRIRAITAAFVAALAACKPLPANVSTTAFILGPTNDIVPVQGEVVTRIDPSVLAASVLIETTIKGGVKFCSGTLIGADSAAGRPRILTNHHCFAQEGSDGLALPALLPEACVATRVHFGFVQGQLASSTIGTCEAGSLRTTFAGDLAVFTLASAPPERFRPLGIWSSSEGIEGRAAVVVHYPDVASAMAQPPDGGPALPAAQATIDDCRVVGPFAAADFSLDRSLPVSIRHTCDLIHGSSGSGLIDVRTGQILGVNWGGIQINGSSKNTIDNVATSAAYVTAFLAGREAQALAAALAAGAATTKQDQNAGAGDLSAKAQRLLSGGKGACGVIGSAGTARPLPRNFAVGLWLLGPFAAIATVAACRRLTTYLCLGR